MNNQFLIDIQTTEPELIVDDYIDAVLEIPSINTEMRQKQIDEGYYLLLQVRILRISTSDRFYQKQL